MSRRQKSEHDFRQRFPFCARAAQNLSSQRPPRYRFSYKTVADPRGPEKNTPPDSWPGANGCQFLRRRLPSDLGAKDKELRMNPVEIGPVEGGGKLEHIEPVRHDADSCFGTPNEAQGEVRLPAALDVGAGAKRLQEQASKKGK
jgi:hypothetical protein